jgi:hypothetical protein
VDVVTVGVAGLALVGLAVAFLVFRSRRRPLDPEERLRLLVGPAGMAAGERNRQASDRKWQAELLESVTKAAGKRRAEGDIPGAQKLEEYAQTLRDRGYGGG